MKIICCFLFLLSAFKAFGADPAPDWRILWTNWNHWAGLPDAELEKRAQAKDPIAQHMVYVRTVRQQPKDKTKWDLAERYLAEASEAGLAQAAHKFYFKFQHKDWTQYMRWLEIAARDGYPPAAVDLAKECLQGQRIDRNDERALELIRRAADLGYASAQFELAEMYSCGTGEPRNSEEVPMTLYLRAANWGNGDAMVKLGHRYRVGLGTEKDFMESARWYWRASQKGKRYAERFINPTIPLLSKSDPDTAVFTEFLALYFKAQEESDPAIMLQVGRAFLEGRYGKPNFVSAYVWLARSAAAGNPEAVKLSQTAKSRLTPEQIRRTEEEIGFRPKP
jgi:TPR repeat protein